MGTGSQSPSSSSSDRCSSASRLRATRSSARSLQEGILSKKTQEHLERHLRADGFDDKVHGFLLCDAAPSIHDDTPVVIDPTDVQKPYAERMPYLAKVWDGSEGRSGTACPGSASTTDTTSSCGL